MIPEHTVQKILETAQIEDVVGDFVNLKRAGRNYKGLCPFHDEKTPSFSVSPGLNIYKCFGCQKGGNSVQFIMEHEKMSFPEALRYLADKYNIEIEEEELSEERKAELQEIDSLYVLNEHVSKFYTEQLFHTNLGKSVGLSYFRDRGFNQKTLDRFKIGYAAPGGKVLVDELNDKGFTIDYAKKVGLVNTYEKDFFKDRVIFPIQNISGKTIAFAGRTLKKDKKIPKYINSPESDIYEKRKVLYGLYQAKGAIRKENSCIIVEGYTDVMSLHQVGIENVVASSGTALTEEQVRLIKRFADEVLVLYDGDAAGVSAAVRGLRIILSQGLKVQVVMLPEGEDPDSFAQKRGKQATLDFLENQKKDFILWQLEHLLAETANDPMGKARAIKSIVRTLAHIEDALTRSTYIQHCAQELHIQENLLVDELNKALYELQAERQRIQKSQARKEQQWKKQEPSPVHSPSAQLLEEKKRIPSKVDIREKEVIRVLLQHGAKMIEDEEGIPLTVAEYVFSELENLSESMTHPSFQSIIDLYLQSLMEGVVPEIKQFTQNADRAVQTVAIDILTEPFEYSENWEGKLNSPLRTQKKPEENFATDSFLVVQHFKQKQLERLIQQNREKLQAFIEVEDEKGVADCMAVHHRLVEVRKEINDIINRVIL